jgi:Protein of unknown function (DUF2442)
MSIGKLLHLTAGGVQTIIAGWDDGFTATVDLSEIIIKRKNLAPIHNPAEFAKAALSADGWSVEWPFRGWMDRHGLTLDRAADALGLSRRTIAYYLSGEQPVPKTVMLATEGYDHRCAA